MLQIEVPSSESFDEKESKFIVHEPQVLKLEHSLISISKWESRWKKPFLTEEPKSVEEILSYIECMCIQPVSDRSVFYRLSKENQKAINDYISDSMTATWFNDHGKKPSREIITSEVIYAQMIALGIPIEFEKWHINRLLTQIKVCNIMFNNDSKSKMSKKDIFKSNRELNEARRRKANSKG